METYSPSSDNRGIYDQITSLSSCSLLRSLSEEECFVSLDLWAFVISGPCIQLRKHSGIFFFFCKTNNKYTSQLTSGGKCWKSFSSDAATKDRHEHLRHAERVADELKPPFSFFPEYILMHFRPLTRVHKAIKAATDKRTCRKIIKRKVLWRTGPRSDLLPDGLMSRRGRRLLTTLRVRYLAKGRVATNSARAANCWRDTIYEDVRGRTGFRARDALHVWVLN